MNVSGHRISTTEVESALVSHPKVAEAAVVGATDETTGQGIVAFVILRAGVEGGPDVVADLRAHVAHEIGPIAKPRQVLIVRRAAEDPLGQIMRRLLRDVAEHRRPRRCHHPGRPDCHGTDRPGPGRRGLGVGVDDPLLGLLDLPGSRGRSSQPAARSTPCSGIAPWAVPSWR